MFCSRCGVQLPGPEKHCSPCQSAGDGTFHAAQQESSRPVTIWIIVLTGTAGLVLALGLFGLLTRTGRSTTTKAPAVRIAATPPPGLLNPAQCLDFVSKPYGSVNEYSTKISGAIKNNCRRDFRYVKVSFKLFDSSGTTVGIAFANLAGLPDGETWRFQAEGFTPSVHYRVDEITAR